MTQPTFIKISYGTSGATQAMIGTGCRTDVQDVADYLDDIDAFREIGLGERAAMAFDPRELASTVRASDPARFVRGEVAEALRRLALELAGETGEALAELVA